MNNINQYTVNPPCRIFSLSLGMPQSYKEKLIQESYKLKNRENRENQPVFKYLFHEEGEKKVIGSDMVLWKESNLYNILLKNIFQAFLHLYPDTTKDNEYGIYNSWLGIYDKTQHTKPHHHSPFYISFCYYISAEEPYTPMVFNEVGLEVDAVTDRLILFPSHILHSVPPCKGDERIMIAGNIGPKTLLSNHFKG